MSMNVSGPVSAYRLEKDGKVVYLFGDFHFPLEYQQQCPDIRTINFVQYFLKQHDGLDKGDIIDFFLEIDYETVRDIKTTKYNEYNWGNYAVKYLVDLRRLFFKSLSFNKNTTQMQQSKLLPNARFHYFDFRNVIKYEESLAFKMNSTFFNNMWKTGTMCLNSINELIVWNGMHKNEMVMFKNIMLGNSIKIPNNEASQTRLTLFIKLFDKIRNKYKNQGVKRIINAEIENVLLKTMDEHLLMSDKIDKQLKKIKTNVLKNEAMSRKNKLDELVTLNLLFFNTHTQYTDIFLLVVDYYLLRRLLDKEYVKRAVIYSGHAHTLHYLKVLIERFGFTLTHATNGIHSGDKYIKTVNKIIKKPIITLLAEIETYHGDQCVDLSKFPSLFK